MSTIMEEEAVDLIEEFKSTAGQDLKVDMTFNLSIFNVLWRIVAGKRYKVL